MRNLNAYTDGDLRAWLDTLEPETRERLHEFTATPIGPYRCTKCSGHDVELAEWTAPNKGIVAEGGPMFENLSYAAERGQSWCNDCEAHTVLEYEENTIDRMAENTE